MERIAWRVCRAVQGGECERDGPKQCHGQSLKTKAEKEENEANVHVKVPEVKHVRQGNPARRHLGQRWQRDQTVLVLPDEKRTDRAQGREDELGAHRSARLRREVGGSLNRPEKIGGGKNKLATDHAESRINVVALPLALAAVLSSPHPPACLPSPSHPLPIPCPSPSHLPHNQTRPPPF